MRPRFRNHEVIRVHMRSTVEEYAAVIIGGGPAGLFCAAQAASEGLSVLLLEKMPSCGRKLLITGSGQCNLTHEGDVREFIAKYGDHGPFLRMALRAFPPGDLMAWFSARGLPLETDESGKVFPASRKASDVLAVLIRECGDRGVEIRCSAPVREVMRDAGGFCIRSDRGEYRAPSLVIATGGCSYPATGSTGDGFSFARALGHTLIPARPALTPVYVEGYPFSDLAGVSFSHLSFALFRDGRKLRAASGDLLFTHTGLSGPGILHISRTVLPGDLLKVSFLPAMSADVLKRDLAARTAASGQQTVKRILAGYPLPARFLTRIADIAGIPTGMTGAHLTKKDRDELVRLLTAFPFWVTRPGGWNEAMVTSGGICLDEINPKTMESRRVPGLYGIGEVLDIDGDTGGYNLQAAFSTAMAAARALCGR